jgi:photosystem II stability/assembly factor-like uncharacterized protein
VHWDTVLSGASSDQWQLRYSPEIEENRPIFLLSGGYRAGMRTSGDQATLYRSRDGGLTWRTVHLEESIVPTALAISPRFREDGLLFVGTNDGRVLTLADSELRD